ncbi:MAG: hypothetical protein WCJ56_01845 [bacterium]
MASRQELLAFQTLLLRETLEFATEQVPAYQRFKGIVARLSPTEALQGFPLLDKDTLQADLNSYLPRDFAKIPHYECTTGGTSGNQLRLYLDDDSQAIDMACMHRQWARVGYTPQQRKATFRGVPFPNLKPGIYWQYNPIYNEMQFSPFHMNDATLGAYVEELIKFNPAFFHGYPSAISFLAEYVERKGIGDKLPKIRAVLLGSEGCLPEQRERIERAFNTRVFSWYGHSERVLLAGECEKSTVYHHFPDYGVLEIITDDGASCIAEGERGELVGTGFSNRCLPLIRYRTGDYATRCNPKCECGREWDRFNEVEGHRKQEYILGVGGTQITAAALNMHGPLFEKVIRYQYYQEAIGQCELRLMVQPEFTENDRLLIEKAYKDKIAGTLELTVSIVADIPLTSRGKMKLVNSTVSKT